MKVEIEQWRLEKGYFGEYHRQGGTVDSLETFELDKKTVGLLGLAPCQTCYPDAYEEVDR